MKTLRKFDKEVISKVNEFRSAAKSILTYDHAAVLFHELDTVLPYKERDSLGEAWRNSYVDNTTVEIDNACDSVVNRIQTGR